MFAPQQIRGFPGKRASMISSVRGLFSSMRIGLASQRSTRPPPSSRMASRCSKLSEGHGGVEDTWFDSPGVQATALERCTARRISFSVTTRPHPTVTARSVSRIAVSVRQAWRTRATRKSHKFTPSPAFGGDASKSRTNCGSSLVVFMLSPPCVKASRRSAARKPSGEFSDRCGDTLAPASPRRAATKQNRLASVLTLKTLPPVEDESRLPTSAPVFLRGSRHLFGTVGKERPDTRAVP